MTQSTRNSHQPNISREPLDVILPAGGRITGEFAQMAGTDIKALIEFNGQTILRRAILTLRATNRVGRIAVIGPEPVMTEARECGAELLLPEGDSGPDNILRGLHGLQGTGEIRDTRYEIREEEGSSFILHPSSFAKVLILTTDLPFLTADTLTAFLDACPPDADIAVPIMTEPEFNGRFPGTQNEYVRLRDGGYTLGCAFVLNGEILLRNEAHLRALFAARKNQWQMARLIGFGTILKFATRRLTVEELETRASAIAGCRGVAVRHSPPELAYDIDLPAEYEYARQQAAKRAQPDLAIAAPTLEGVQEIPR